MYISKNPATESLIAEHQLTSPAELDLTLDLLWQGYSFWRQTSLAHRLSLVQNLQAVIDRRRDEFAKIITTEMGKTIRDSLAEVERIKLFCQHALERAPSILAPQQIPNPSFNAVTTPEPLGIIYAITPWNVPLGTPLRTALPALVTGNTVLVKPAPNVALSAQLLIEALLEAGFPDNVCRVALLPNNLAEDTLRDPRIRKLSFVGSSAVGAHLASIAGSAIKPVLLELGGSDPLIVLPDADVSVAAADAARVRCFNAGQVCCSSKRMIVCEAIYDQFRDQFIAAMKSKRTGDPLDERTDYGPLARADIRDQLTRQVARSIASGSKVLLTGGARDGVGYFFEPTILEESSQSNFASHEELFGPVATLICAKDTGEAIAIANRSPYGLGAAVYSKNTGEAEQVATQLECGFVHINRTPGLHPYLPFGGVKNSGYGRDCGDAGYLEFVNQKLIVRDKNS